MPEADDVRGQARLIMNADDFGKDAETVRATVSCFEEGVLSSATIMPNMPATRQAVDFALEHGSFSYGVHLTFVGDGQERPISDPAEIRALVSSDGRFLPSRTVRRRALLGQIPAIQIEREMTAQLRKIVEMGVPVSHVDSHCHLHKFRAFLTVLERVLPHFGVDRVRTAQDLFITRQPWRPTYWYGGVWGRRIRERFRTTDHFFMPSSVGDACAIEDVLAMTSGGTVEIGGHPGCSGWRDAERIAMRNLFSAASASGHEIISWRRL